MKSPKILMVVTSAANLPNGEPTGLWLEEFAVPYEVFRKAGAAITVASPRGGSAPIDPRSKPNEAEAARWREASEMLVTTIPLSAVKAEDFDAMFLARWAWDDVRLSRQQGAHAAIARLRLHQ